MIGPVIVSFIAVSLPVVAGLSLSPKRDRDRAKLILMDQGRGYMRSWMRAAQARNPMQHLLADLDYSSTDHAD